MPDTDLRTADFDYELPEELIAARPLDRRDGSRLMIVDRARGSIQHARFSDFPGQLREGDLVVLNDTRVVKARFFSDDGRIELLRLDYVAPGVWRSLVKPGKKMRPGDTVVVGGAVGTVVSVYEDDGSREIRWDREPDESAHGHLALPHYMNREDEAEDIERYQTVFANPEKSGAIAAPTAGLHFTPELLATLPHAFLTLHVGVGTFRPVKADFIRDHTMHSERYEIGVETAEKIRAARRVVAVGTTVTRVLEHSMRVHGAVVPHSGETDIFLHPGVKFGAVGALLTNFHLPKSTLLMLVSAFAGSDLTREAYRQAVAEKYRFFSYGDCMLIV